MQSEANIYIVMSVVCVLSFHKAQIVSYFKPCHALVSYLTIDYVYLYRYMVVPFQC